MSTHAASRRRAGAARRRGSGGRRFGALVLAAFVGLLVVAVLPTVRHAAKEIELPLRHEDIIRQQSAEKGIDPSLVAAVIFAESKFTDSESRAGALGLMQLTPQTARGIAQRTGGSAFTTEDLSTPQVNIAYGTWYLRHLLVRYGGDETAALAAYNAGMGNVDRWMAEARAAGHRLGPGDIPFGETRAYVIKVLAARKAYRRQYAGQLGL